MIRLIFEINDYNDAANANGAVANVTYKTIDLENKNIELLLKNCRYHNQNANLKGVEIIDND